MATLSILFKGLFEPVRECLLTYVIRYWMEYVLIWIGASRNKLKKQILHFMKFGRTMFLKYIIWRFTNGKLSFSVRKINPSTLTSQRDLIVSFLDSIHKRLTEKTLEMIRKERQGEQIESRIIKKVIHSYVEIGQAVNVSQIKSEKKLKNYDERFLEAFLVDTGLFYAAESSHYINTHSISDYLKKERLKTTYHFC